MNSAPAEIAARGRNTGLLPQIRGCTIVTVTPGHHCIATWLRCYPKYICLA